MSVFAGPRTPFIALKDGTTGSFWSPRVISSLWADTAGTVPASVDGEVKRMDDLSGLGNHMTMTVTTRTATVNGVAGTTVTTHGPTLRRDGKLFYLEFDGVGACLYKSGLNGTWTGANTSIRSEKTVCVAFWTESPQPIGFGGTWLGSNALGNFTSLWNFGLRLSTEVMHYCTVRNNEDTAWVTCFEEGDRYSNLNTSAYYNKPVIYTAEGSVGSGNVVGGREWINGELTVSFSDVAIANTTLLPRGFNNSVVTGSRDSNNDNWIKGRFYGGFFVNRALTEQERRVVERFLYINCFN